jgi:hypothetical protein
MVERAPLKQNAGDIAGVLFAFKATEHYSKTRLKPALPGVRRSQEGRRSTTGTQRW